MNDTFFVPGSNAPVFLCVGGEGPPLDGSVVVASVHCNVAVEWLPATGALMLAVEHRYYGCHNASACPYSAADPQPLKWLSSRQALADLATFHAHATAAFGLTAQNKWVSWGGSYPGMLAGWFRVTYPNLVHAAVASSAPVIAKLDMQEYNDVTAEAYALPSVGGSDACRANIADGHATIGAMLNTSSGRDALAKTFRLPSGRWLKSRANQRGFAGFGVANFPSQSNDPACTAPLCNIAKICEVMAANDTKTNVERLAVLRNGGAGARAAAARAAEASAVEEEAAAAARSPHETLDYWGYQTCTEFGFYQTCEYRHRVLLHAGARPPRGQRRLLPELGHRADRHPGLHRRDEPVLRRRTPERDADPLPERRRRPVARPLDPDVAEPRAPRDDGVRRVAPRVDAPDAADRSAVGHRRASGDPEEAGWRGVAGGCHKMSFTARCSQPKATRPTRSPRGRRRRRRAPPSPPPLFDALARAAISTPVAPTSSSRSMCIFPIPTRRSWTCLSCSSWAPPGAGTCE